MRVVRSLIVVVALALALAIVASSSSASETVVTPPPAAAPGTTELVAGSLLGSLTFLPAPRHNVRWRRLRLVASRGWEPSRGGRGSPRGR
jgi:hypothetical protein